MKFSFLCIRNLPRFLRDNHYEAVADFADPDAGAMSCAQAFGERGVVRKRKITGCCRNPVTPDDNSTVVQRCIMFKNINQQLTADNRINRDPCMLIVIQTDIVFDLK